MMKKRMVYVLGLSAILLGSAAEPGFAGLARFVPGTKAHREKKAVAAEVKAQDKERKAEYEADKRKARVNKRLAKKQAARAEKLAKLSQK